jgi:hypothetical protein
MTFASPGLNCAADMEERPVGLKLLDVLQIREPEGSAQLVRFSLTGVPVYYDPARRTHYLKITSSNTKSCFSGQTRGEQYGEVQLTVKGT